MLKLHETLEETFEDYTRETLHTASAMGGFIHLDDETISFTLQAGNVGDNGVNGVQCEEILLFVKGYLNKLNSHVPSDYNHKAIRHIDAALTALNQRTEDRLRRGVEGTEND